MHSRAIPQTKTEDPLAVQISAYYDDPLGFVLDCYPWGTGELAGAVGPDTWQEKLLNDIGQAVRERKFNGSDPVAPLRFAIASGHGIGKSVIVAWIANWIMSTRPGSQGTVTANTYTQLETKTWAAIQKWTNLCITRDWWVVMGTGLYHKESRATWFLNCQTCSEENSEAFAGQHAANSTSYYLIDEASAVPDKTEEVAQGGLTDGEPMMFAFGNPTRNTGWFYEAVFGKRRHRWNHRSIDSRTCRFPNKQEIDAMIQDFGLDSDRVRVRVLGEAPNQDEAQFIGKAEVKGAQQREVYVLDDEPLVCGFDVSGGGSAWNIIRFRRGLDARPGPMVPAPIRIPGSQADRASLIARCAQVLREQHSKRRVSMMFVDSAFGAAIVERLHVLGYDNVIEVNFGGRSPDAHQENMRAYMWNAGKEWLAKGSIDPNDEKLEIDLTSPGFHFNKSNKLVLESKQDMMARGVPSPDDGDALILTFASPIAAVDRDGGQQETRRRIV